MVRKKEEIKKLVTEIAERVKRLEGLVSSEKIDFSEIQKSKKRKSIKLGPVALIDILIKEGFFKKPRTAREIREQLKIKGVTATADTVRKELLRKIRPPTSRLQRRREKSSYVYFAS